MQVFTNHQSEATALIIGYLIHSNRFPSKCHVDLFKNFEQLKVVFVRAIATITAIVITVVINTVITVVITVVITIVITTVITVVITAVITIFIGSSYYYRNLKLGLNPLLKSKVLMVQWESGQD